MIDIAKRVELGKLAKELSELLGDNPEERLVVLEKLMEIEGYKPKIPESIVRPLTDIEGQK